MSNRFECCRRRVCALVSIAIVVLVSCPVPRAGAGTGAPPPRLFFTDLESGPVTGGEAGLGVFISIYGEGFGAVRGSSTVTVNGREVARYVTWGSDNAPARDLDLVVVQPGGNVTTGDIVLTVDGQPSNGLPFTVRDGAIYVVAPGAPNASDGNSGTFDAPFRTIHRPRESMQAGDVCYVREGRYDTLDPDYAGWDAVLMVGGASTQTGTADRPVAFVGYPGETALLAGAEARRGVLFIQDEGPMDHFVIANLSFTEVRFPVGVTGVGHRVVGNEFHDGARDDSGVIGVNGDTSQIEVLGNRLFRNGEAGEKLFHGFYIGGYGTNRAIEFGWNEVDDQRGGRAVQLYGHIDGDFMDEILIHDNFLRGAELNNIVVGGSDGSNDVIGTVRIWNNVVVGAADAGLRVNTTDGVVIVEQNTLHGNGFAQLYVERAGAGGVTMRNNILSCEPGQEYAVVEDAAPGALVAGFNLYHNGGDPPGWDSASRTGDPLFVNASGGDFRIGADSPAVDTGTPTGEPYDFLGVARPQDDGFDIGAFEVAGTGPPPPPDLPQLTGSWTRIRLKPTRKVKARFECRNIGRVASGVFVLQPYFATSDVLGADAVAIAPIEVGPIQPGQSITFKVNAKQPSGYGYIIAVVDATRVVRESDEDDNVIAGQIP